jgi:hypothetical protein
MRRLNDFEKKICLRIFNENGSRFGYTNLIYEELDRICISINRESKYVEFQINEDMIKNYESWLKINNHVFEVILISVRLLEMLEKEGYIFLIKRSHVIIDETFGKGDPNLDHTNYPLPDSEISEMIIKYTEKEIYITKEFHIFCKNGFKPKDDYRFQRQIFITTTALFVAIIALLINTTFNIINKSKTATKIQQDQIDSLRSDLKNINSNITKISFDLKGNGIPRNDKKK